jgi:hypothetical protein
MIKYIYYLSAHIMYYVLLKIYWNLHENKKALCIAFYWKDVCERIKVRKYSGSHRELRPTGTEYEINDDQLRNRAAHSGLP